MKQTLERLKKEDLTFYAPIPFWSWNNRLEKDKLLKQMRRLKEVGCGGFVMHARTGLTTEYLSEEWFSLIEACLDEAKKLNMRAWIYDENGWPSGFVGGKLLEDEENLALYFEKIEKTEFDETAYAVFEKDGDKFRRLKNGDKSCNGIYQTVYLHRSPANTDILNPKVVTKFIDATYEEYYKRFSDRFGKELVGFFTDEPQYFRWATPFAFEMTNYWKQEYNEDIADKIIALFYETEENYEFRFRYYKAMNKLYTENYYKRIYEWCDEHNCMLTGHSVEETKLFSQMWGCAGCSPSYEFEHVPGIDNLGENGSAKLSARQVGSVCRQLGIKQILTETFGCSGYGVSPKKLKAIAEKQYVHGVNLMCHHLYAYSLSRQGKTDHPPCFSEHMTWSDEFVDFNLYFSRLGYLLANSKTLVNCVVISPLTSVYLKYDRFNEEESQKIDVAFDKFQSELNKNGILYDIADEKILSEHGKVQNSALTIGLQNYDYVIVPDCLVLSSSTKAILQKYVADGGKIFVASLPAYTDGVKDNWDFLKSNICLAEIAKNGSITFKTDGNVEYTYRKGADFDFLYIVNVENEDANIVIPDGFSKIDLLNLKLLEQTKEVRLGAGESILLTTDVGEKTAVYGDKTDITSNLCFVKTTDNNLTLDYASLSTDGKNYGANEPLVAMFDRLLRQQYCGKIFVKYSFNAKDFGKKITLRREKGKYLSSSFNGNPLNFTQSTYDFMFEEADISKFMVKGANEYVNEIDFYEREHVFWALYSPTATESVRNCLWYDTELENVYIQGEFCVDNNRNLVAPYAPKEIAQLQKDGYPFFAGRVYFNLNLFAISDMAKLCVEGNYTAVEIFVNEKYAGACFFGSEIEIPLNKEKENTITIVAVSSLRNMFGPFHFKQDESFGVSPYCFTMRGGWKDGKCDMFDENYKLIPFGISNIGISFKK